MGYQRKTSTDVRAIEIILLLACLGLTAIMFHMAKDYGDRLDALEAKVERSIRSN